ncbi:VOC family protein [Myceligenerans salitolerans]|uniref:VOC family protein n=1 Tax=Myceligenerans salitolerans TaxID=1230528 RepID=A0ABS3IAM2_9MICO|nr:VOC family protein [Myceligenerans salitolerans]MBO0610076.1 VOC family protein [Myceligenerans salitolerans]
MAVNTVTHLNFHGEARAALEFYGEVFGGTATIITYGDFGMPAQLPDAGKVVWGQVVSGNGFRVMAYDVPSSAGDGPTSGETSGAGSSTRRENGMTVTTDPFFVSVRGDDVEEVGKLWEKLADGATVVEQYGPARWAPAFGMLTDRFGVTWILDVAAPYPAS